MIKEMQRAGRNRIVSKVGWGCALWIACHQVPQAARGEDPWPWSEEPPVPSKPAVQQAGGIPPSAPITPGGPGGTVTPLIPGNPAPPVLESRSMPENPDAVEEDPLVNDLEAAAAASAGQAEGADSGSLPFEQGEQDLSLIESEMGAQPALTQPVRSAAAGGIDVAAYDELLRENVDLRREITELEQGAGASAAERLNLENEIKDLERQVQASVALLQQAPKGDGSSEASAAAVRELESALAQVRAENDQLRTQLSTAAAGGGPTPAAGSDLFRALQTENAELKRRLDEAENARQAATTELASGQATGDAARSRALDLEQALQASQAEQARLQKTIAGLTERVPAMEQELVELRDTVGTQDRDLATKSSDLETLRLEMEKREQRLIKAERMAALMDKTREEVQAVSKKEQRDLHYNMATVYAKEGRHREAEQEYLHALRVDPTDAGSHYNLGLLYEDIFGDKRKATMHYRAYLKLAPNADDVDEVKNWLVQLEMN